VFPGLYLVITGTPSFFDGPQGLKKSPPLAQRLHPDFETDMGGRSWVVTALDWNRREAFVIPATGRGKSQWLGGGMGMSYRLSWAIHGVLTDADVSPRWFNRARQTIESLRGEYAFLHAGEDVVLQYKQMIETRWFTFAGGVINTALADAIRACGVNEVSSSDFLIKITETTGGRSLVDRIRQKTGDQIISFFIVSDEFMEKLKFYECLPKPMVRELLRGRMLNPVDIKDTVDRAIVSSVICS
jgi:ATP-dependent Lhr-like helicase